MAQHQYLGFSLGGMTAGRVLTHLDGWWGLTVVVGFFVKVVDKSESQKRKFC